MIYFALKEVDAVRDTFKRWFDAGDAQKVKEVLQKMFHLSGVGQPTTLMQNWVCERDDVIDESEPSQSAYPISKPGQFQVYPKGLRTKCRRSQIFRSCSSVLLTGLDSNWEKVVKKVQTEVKIK